MIHEADIAEQLNGIEFGAMLPDEIMVELTKNNFVILMPISDVDHCFWGAINLSIPITAESNLYVVVPETVFHEETGILYTDGVIKENMQPIDKERYAKIFVTPMCICPQGHSPYTTDIPEIQKYAITRDGEIYTYGLVMSTFFLR